LFRGFIQAALARRDKKKPDSARLRAQTIPT
jgi:hypothetical protein